MNKFEIVCWPESQYLMEMSGFFENCSLINTPRGLETYGSSAYLVNKDWYEQLQKGELEMLTPEEVAEWEDREDEWGVIDEMYMDEILFGEV